MTMWVGFPSLLQAKAAMVEVEGGGVGARMQRSGGFA